MFILKKLRKLSKVLAICLVFGSLSSITAHVGAKSYDSTQINCIAKNAYMEVMLDKGMKMMYYLILIED